MEKTQRSVILDVLILLAFAAFSWWLMSHTFFYKQGEFSVGGKVWSDFGGHIPLIRSFSMGENFPPEYPLFSGVPIKYHFLFYYIVGTMEKFGVNLALAFNLLSALGMTLFLWMIYSLTRMIFSSTRAGILAIVLFLFYGSLSFVLFFQQHPLNPNSFHDIISAKKFVSFGPWGGDVISAFWTLNIYTNQRHLALSYAIVLLFLRPLIAFTCRQETLSLQRKIILLLIISYLPLLNQVIIPLILIYSFVWMVFHPKTIKPFWSFYVLIPIVAIPAILYFKKAGVEPPVVDMGYLASQLKIYQGFPRWLYYWLYNLGLYVFLIPILFWWGNRQVKALLSAGLILFTISNIFRFSTDMINNHKFINFFMLTLEIASAGLLIELYRWSNKSKVLAGIVLIGLTFSGVIDFFPVANDDAGFLMKDVEKSEVMSWIVRETPKNSVFLCSECFNNPAVLVGRKLFGGYVYFTWSHGYPAYERAKIIKEMFAEDIPPQGLCIKLKINRIDYVITHQNKGDWEPVDVQKSYIVKNWTPEYASPENIKIYSVADQCGNL